MNVFDESFGLVGGLISVYLLLVGVFVGIVTIVLPFSIGPPLNIVAGIYLFLVLGWCLSDFENAALTTIAVTPAILGLGGGGWALAGFAWPALALAYLYSQAITSAQQRERQKRTRDEP